MLFVAEPYGVHLGGRARFIRMLNRLIAFIIMCYVSFRLQFVVKVHTEDFMMFCDDEGGVICCDSHSVMLFTILPLGLLRFFSCDFLCNLNFKRTVYSIKVLSCGYQF
jgi:hypothetical protein